MSNRNKNTAKQSKTTTTTTITHKKTTQTINRKTSISITSYPAGKIVNSKVLSDVERGYLELAGFNNYKEALMGLETSSQRSKIAKNVSASPTLIGNVVKKIELLQIKGVNENSAVLLNHVGITSVAHLQKANPQKVKLKIDKVKDKDKSIKGNLTENQLKTIITSAKEKK